MPKRGPPKQSGGPATTAVVVESPMQLSMCVAGKKTSGHRVVGKSPGTTTKVVRQTCGLMARD